MARKITIQDIAKQAGVSKATVSRVLNHKPDVDPETRHRILAIIDEQGFVPSIVASGLAGGRSRLIGVLIPALTWPLIPELMRGVGEIIEHTAYELVLYSVNDSNHEKDRSDIIDHILSSRLVAGLLAIYPGQSVQHLKMLHKQGMPVVMLDDQELPPEELPWVGANQRLGAYEATRHLLQQGHRRIAHIQGPLKYQVSLDRYQGYCQALAEAGLQPDPAIVVQGDFMPPSGRECASYLLTGVEERPTAIFAASDLMAFGAIAAAEQHGLRVPEDVAIVGFDDISSAAHIRPALTTVRQPLYEMGQRAMELLLHVLEAAEDPVHDVQNSSYVRRSFRPMRRPSTPSHIQLETRLVVRESCGAIRNFSLYQ
ncbi:MAG TPA: LacI family DNA-binding transcriptional regulator [Ktedonobacteraceae bacterium]|jgi:LacI family transcriptional regulator